MAYSSAGHSWHLVLERTADDYAQVSLLMQWQFTLTFHKDAEGNTSGIREDSIMGKVILTMKDIDQSLRLGETALDFVNFKLA